MNFLASPVLLLHRMDFTLPKMRTQTDQALPMDLALGSQENSGTVILGETAGIVCGCDSDKIRAVHAYLKKHFPDRMLSDLHFRSVVMHGEVEAPGAEHHVVSIETDGLPYSAVVSQEFLEHSGADMEERLWQWNVAMTLRVHGIVIVWSNGVSPLQLANSGRPRVEQGPPEAVRLDRMASPVPPRAG